MGPPARSYAHVRAELEAYAGLGSPGSYVVAAKAVLGFFPARPDHRVSSSGTATTNPPPQSRT